MLWPASLINLYFLYNILVKLMRQLFHLLRKQNKGSQMRSDFPRFSRETHFLHIFIVTYCDLNKMYFVLSGTYF